MKNLRTFNNGTDKVELKKGLFNREMTFFIFMNDVEVAKYPVDYKFLAEEKYRDTVKKYQA